MIRGIHYFSTELKTKIDVIQRGCFNYNPHLVHIDPKLNMFCDTFVEMHSFF